MEPGAGQRVVQVSVGDCLVYVEAQDLGGELEVGEEVEIGGARPTLERLLDGVAAVAGQLGERFESSRATKMAVEFGCNVAVESGTFFAVIGKASAQSSFKVTLEWTRPPS